MNAPTPHHPLTLPDFTDADLLDRLLALPPEARDGLDFGVIGFDRSTHVVQYNAYESRAARLEPARVLGKHLFIEVAPCMNNHLVAQRFEAAGLEGRALDETVPYVLTFRMRPTPVQLRLLARPGAAVSYVLVQRPQDAP